MGHRLDASLVNVFPRTSGCATLRVHEVRTLHHPSFCSVGLNMIEFSRDDRDVFY